MKKSSNRPIGALAVIFPLVCLMPQPVSGQVESTLVAGGLNGPMGITVDGQGQLWVVDSGVGGDTEIQFPDPSTGALKAVRIGESSRVLRLDDDGEMTEMAALPSIQLGPGEVIGGSRLAMLGASMYVAAGTWAAAAPDKRLPRMAAVVRVTDGHAAEIANTFDIESRLNPDSLLVDSNPFGLAAGSEGDLWITDAAANTLLKLDPESGELSLVTVFEAIPSPIPNPNHDGRMETDPVPTGVAFDSDGELFVTLLPGFPFVPGSARVVHVAADGSVSDYATGLTMLVDLTLGPDGRLYAVSLGRFTEKGPEPNTGAIVRVGEGDTSTEVATGLPFPTSIAFNERGDAFVTVNGVGAPGSGEIVKFAALANAD